MTSHVPVYVYQQRDPQPMFCPLSSCQHDGWQSHMVAGPLALDSKLITYKSKLFNRVHLHYIIMQCLLSLYLQNSFQLKVKLMLRKRNIWDEKEMG